MTAYSAYYNLSLPLITMICSTKSFDMVERRSDKINFKPEKHLSTDTWNTKIVIICSRFDMVKRIMNTKI